MRMEGESLPQVSLCVCLCESDVVIVMVMVVPLLHERTHTSLRRWRNISPHCTNLWYMIIPHTLRSYLIIYYRCRVYNLSPLSLAILRAEVASVCSPPRVRLPFVGVHLNARITIIDVMSNGQYNSRERIKYERKLYV